MLRKKKGMCLYLVSRMQEKIT